jgi:hypothetical protein
VDRDNFLAEVPDIVPACVASVHEFWRNYQKPPPSEAAASREAADASDATTGINQQLVAQWSPGGDRRLRAFGDNDHVDREIALYDRQEARLSVKSLAIVTP